MDATIQIINPVEPSGTRVQQQLLKKAVTQSKELLNLFTNFSNEQLISYLMIPKLKDLTQTMRISAVP